MNRAIFPLCGLLLIIFSLPVDGFTQEFGRGRFLKRLRDELMGRRDADKSKEKKSKTDSRASNSNQNKKPTLARPNPASRYQPSSQYRQPNSQLNSQLNRQPVGSGYRGSSRQGSNSRRPSGSSRTPTALDKLRSQPRDAASRIQGPTPSQITRQAREAAGANAYANPRDDSSFRRPAPPSSLTYPKPVATAKKSKKKTQGRGFGISIKEKGEKVFVNRVDPKGNASKAGLRNGDQIIELGGLEIQNADDFEEFAKVLGQGDQMEFKIRSRGKKKTLMVTYGQAPESGEVEVPGEAPRIEPTTVSRRRSVLENIGDSGSETNEVRYLKRTVESQRQEIATLREELVRLRQQVLAGERKR